MARNDKAVMGLIPASLTHPHWTLRRPELFPGVLLRVPRVAVKISNFEIMII